jgi:hypothetical protein
MNPRIESLYEEVALLGIIPYYFSEPKDKWFRLIERIIKTYSKRTLNKDKILKSISEDLNLNEKELEIELNKIISRIKSKIRTHTKGFEKSHIGFGMPISGSFLIVKKGAREFVIVRPKDNIFVKKMELKVAETCPQMSIGYDFVASHKLVALSKYEYLFLFYLEKI